MNPIPLGIRRAATGTAADVPGVLRAVVDRCAGTAPQRYNSGWEDVLVPFGMLLVGQAYDDDSAAAWARRWIDEQVAAGVVHDDRPHAPALVTAEPRSGVFLAGYCGDWGAAAPLAADSRPLDGARRAALVQIAEHILRGPVRGPDGTLGHAADRNEAWVDTLYYGPAPLARAAAATGKPAYAAEAVRQCLLHARHLRDPRTGCFVHDADFRHGQPAGWLWSRGNGWVVMAFADVLAACPPSVPGYAELLGLYRDLVDGLLRLQHPCGLWRIIPENAESHLETSGSAMIATGIAVGVAHGWIGTRQGVSARRAWDELVTWVDPDGRVLGCQTPAGVGGWEVHKLSGLAERTYGTGSFLRLAAELRTAGLV